jgi:predicted peroxiredoxin
MGKILITSTYGTDDPTRASLPFIAASGALDRGHEPTIVLMGEAVYLLKEGVADSVQGVGFPPLRQLMDKIVDHQVPIGL